MVGWWPHAIESLHEVHDLEGLIVGFTSSLRELWYSCITHRDACSKYRCRYRYCLRECLLSSIQAVRDGMSSSNSLCFRVLVL
jgi:hypothetical protein